MELTQINELFHAAQTGDTAQLQTILAKDSRYANVQNSDGLTLLGYAAHFGNKDAVKLLLAHGADVNATSASKISFIPSNTALHAAIAGEKSFEVIELLLQHQAQTNLFDSNGHTCLHAAAFHCENLELVQMLIEHGADVNARQEGGDSVLSLAIRQGHDAVAEFLRTKGARL
ncbi:hypothetical protein AV540_00955 [Brevibacillus parabrevis]|uniref:ankyrin repeat domain-containing protein n=1 Tax=Brevibacillus parabrevis TaxID=54914 RepID=UPI0007AC002C|nr:ankyrin repeat domain-containing protein [Brevibacillus parabrevis]KZE46210.1 hypothetical protein AV540_00955 [Brevibacillus parabrevis]